MKKTTCLAVCVALLLTVHLQAAESSGAYSIGPGGGGALYDTKINPQDDKNIFITCDMGSVFRTTDGKNFYNPLLNASIGFLPKFFFSPHNENTVYAATHNIISVSQDKGETWNYFFPQPDGIAGVTNDGNHVREIVKTDKVNGVDRVFAKSEIIGVYVHPKDPETVFAFTRGGGQGAGFGSYSDNQDMPRVENPKIYVTRNGGSTWTIFNDTIPGGRLSGGDNGRFAELISGDGRGGLRFPRAEMILFKNELHLLSKHGYFKFDAATGALIDHSIYRNTAGCFWISENGESITAYQMISREDSEDRYNNVPEHRLFPGYVSMKLAPHSSLYPRHIFKTSDGGKTFQLVSGDFPAKLTYTLHGQNRKMHSNITSNNNVRGYVHFKDISVSDDGTLCTLFSAIGRNADNANISSGWESSVAKTTNDGQTWDWIQCGRAVPVAVQFPEGSYPMHLNGPGHSQSGITVSKSNSNHIVTTNAYSANETRNGGLTWRNMSSTRTVINDENFYTTTGIEPAGQMTLAINPFNKLHHLAGWTDIAMWESFDGGKSWRRRNDVEGGTNTSAVAFDPHNKNVILAAFPNRQRDAMHGISNTGYKPATCTDDWELPCEYDGRAGTIRRSDDGGKTWTIVASNIVVGIDGIIFHPAKKGVVYTSTMGGGVYRSVDGGLTWAPFNKGMTVQDRVFGNVQYRGIQIQRLILGKDGKTLLALHGGSSSMPADQTRVYALDIGNDATEWKEIGRPNLETIGPISDMDKTASGVLYAAPQARPAPPRTPKTEWNVYNGARLRPVVNGGAFVSEDNGASWRQIFDSRIDVKIIRSDSRNENVLFLGGGQKMWVSFKGKETKPDDWTEIPGFRFSNPDLIVEDPTDPTRIYVTTFGGGTWLLPFTDGLERF